MTTSTSSLITALPSATEPEETQRSLVERAYEAILERVFDGRFLEGQV